METEVTAKASEMKYEEGQQNLTESQLQAIASEALAEVNKPEEKVDEWKNPADEQNKEQAGDDKAKAEKEAQDKATADLKAKEEADAKVKQEADKKLADAKIAEEKAKKDEEAAKAGDKEAQTRIDAAKLKAKEGEDKPFSIPAESRAKLVEELALKESLTLEEAEAQIVKDEAIVNKYKNNPVEMAKALRHIQSESDKAKAELAAVKKAGNTPPAPVLNNVKDYVESQLSPIKDKVVEAYRKEYPELSEGQEDTYIYALVKKDASDRMMKVLEENQSKLIGAAKEKRATLIMGLAEQDKSFLPDIKAILDRTNDRQIMAKEYDIKDVVFWAKGKQTERLIKEAEERGFKRGQENAKILGEKLPTGSKTPEGNTKNTNKPVLSDEQKERALNMFDIPGMTDAEKFDAFIDTYPEQFKK